MFFAACLATAAMVVVGCSTDAAEAPVTPSRTADPSPRPSASAETAEPVFVITGKARAVDGTTIDLKLTGELPLAAGDPAAAGLLAEFETGCPASSRTSNGQGESAGGSAPEGGGTADGDAENGGAADGGAPTSPDAGPSPAPGTTDSTGARDLTMVGGSLMRLTLTSTPAGLTFAAPIDLGLGSPYAPKTATGDGVVDLIQGEHCLPQYQATRSGIVSAITDYETGTEAPDPTLWLTGFYGFGVTVDSGATIESCAAELTALGRADAADAAGWNEGVRVTAVSCGIGYIGE